MLDALSAAAEEWVDIITAGAPRDTGALAQSGHVDGMDVVFDSPHARAVEEGALPHVVSLHRLVEWVERHSSLFDMAGGAGAAYRIAKGIQDRIAAEGSPPTWFIRSKLDALVGIVDRMVRRRLDALESGVR